MNSFILLLRNKGFSAYLFTQFLGAFNDNLFKQILILYSLNAVLQQRVEHDYTLLAQGLFVLPFLLFSGYAGFFADRFKKHRVLQITKSIEILAMCLAALAFAYDHIPGLLAVLFLMATQSTFFSPAKYGILPEVLPDEELSRANALLELTTFAAIIIGGALGAVIYQFASDQLATVTWFMIILAIVGTISAWWITPTQQINVDKSFSWFPWKEIISGTKVLYQNKTLWLTNLGITWFWFLGAAVQIDVMYLGKVSMNLSDLHTGLLAAFLGIGIGLGSMLAGLLSGDKIELGLVPLGSLGMFFCGLVLPGVTDSYWATGICLFTLGTMAGLYIVPLNALIQEQAENSRKGEILATMNFYTMVGALAAAGIMAIFQHLLELDPVAIISILGTLTLVATIYALKVLPHFFVRLIIYAVSHVLFNIRILGKPHIPAHGPALIVANHLSYLDGLLVTACTQRFVRFMVYKPIYENRWLNPFFKLANAIPVQGGDADAVEESLQLARQALEEGHVVCIFAEGRITRTGNLLPFRKGMERITQGLQIPIIPVHIDGIWGSALSLRKRQVAWSKPLTSPYQLTVSFGEHLQSPASAWTVRRSIQDLGSQAAKARIPAKHHLLGTWIKRAVKAPGRLTFRSDQGSYTQGELLKELSSFQSDTRPSTVAVSLIPSPRTALIHLHLLGKGHVIVPLDPREPHDAQLSKMRIAQASYLLSENTELQNLTAEQDIPAYPLTQQHARLNIPTLLFKYLPKSWVYHHINACDMQSHDVAYRLFSRHHARASDITHANILANVESFAQVFQLSSSDRLLAPLPYAHAYGLISQLWLPLLTDIQAQVVTDGRDYEVITQHLRRYKPTIVMDTHQGFEWHLERTQADLFSASRYVIAAGRHEPDDFAFRFLEKFSVPLLSGYGVTEMAPGIAINTPDIKAAGQLQRGQKSDSVGLPLPGVSVKIVDPNTEEECTPNVTGEIWVTGPGLSPGDFDEKGHHPRQEDWLNTHDYGQWDEEGFLYFRPKPG